MTIVDQIKEKLDIAEVIGSYIKIEKTGKNFKARCPFHNEKTPSFFISTERQNFYCFGCQNKGDVISFVEKVEGLDFKGAIRLLANRANIEITDIKFSKDDSGASSHKELLFGAMEKATLFYEIELKNQPAVVEYLKSRGLEEATIAKWRLGFARPEWRSLATEIMHGEFTREILLEAGLIKIVENSEKFYDAFRGRIMFPIRDSAKRVIAFSGRIWQDEPNAPKYLNSPETPIFKKSEVLYGWDMARDAIRKQDYAILVEGQLDILLSHQAGVINTVASSGTALTEEHLRKIKTLTLRIVIAYDGDTAGNQASKRAAQIALSLGMEVKIADLPESEDPASIVKKDPEQWKQILRDAKPVIQFALEKAKHKAKGVALIREVEKTVLPYITFVQSEIERSHFVRLISDTLNVSEDSLWQSLSKVSTEEKNNRPEMSNTNIVRNPRKTLAGLIYSGLSPGLDNRVKERLGEVLLAEILAEFENEKEVLSYEIESFISPNMIEDVENEILRRVEYEIIQKQLREYSNQLDNSDGEAEIELRDKIASVTKRAEQLSKESSRTE